MPISPQTLSGQILFPDGSFQAGALHFDRHIRSIEPGPAPDDLLILPGFVDTHVHGGNGADTMDGPGAVRTMARFHARHGTTTLLPTTITSPWDEVLGALHAVKEVLQGGPTGGADIPGAHLEGPFISPQRLGAQPPHAVEPTAELVREVLGLEVIRAVTLAPELPGAADAALAFARAGARVGVGHTAADADTVQAFLKTVRAAGGQTCATHLFNAMGGIEGRVPGPPGALLADPQAYLEIILDTVHVHPTSFLLARAAAPGRVVLITDAMRASGLGDGESELGGQRVTVRGGRAMLDNGSLAGSVLTMDAALRNAVACGIPLAEASRMLSLTPARSLGLSDRGELLPGLRADFVVLDSRLNVQAVYVGGCAAREVPA